MLFVDIRGFTALAEHSAPADIARRLNPFYELAAQAIFRHDGTLDKLVGDQVMAFFGAPLDCADHARRAVRTAQEIMIAVSSPAGAPGLALGIGIASGAAFVGNVGGGAIADYTVIGDTVNVAARLQGEAASGEILLSAETYAQVDGEFPGASRRVLSLKGKNQPVIAWEIGRESPAQLR